MIQIAINRRYKGMEGLFIHPFSEPAMMAGSGTIGLEIIEDLPEVDAERNHVIAEGAGATSVAAALSGKAGSGKVVCVVSGGNIDSDKLAKIFQGQIP